MYKFLWQHLILTAVPQESDLCKLELAQAKLKRLEEENASLKEAKFGLERFYSDDNSDAETGGRFRKSEKTVLKVVICPWLTSSLSYMLGSLPLWPLRSVVNKNMPESFRITYPFTRVTLDCTEEKVQTPSSKVLNSQITRNTKTTPHLRVSLVLHLVEPFHSLVLYTMDGFQTKKSQLDPEYLIY